MNRERKHNVFTNRYVCPPPERKILVVKEHLAFYSLKFKDNCSRSLIRLFPVNFNGKDNQRKPECLSDMLQVMQEMLHGEVFYVATKTSYITKGHEGALTF